MRSRFAKVRRQRNLIIEHLEDRRTPSITWNVAFKDPGHTYADYYDVIRANLRTAGQEWGRYFHSARASIELTVQFQKLEDNIFANAGSDTSVFFQKNGKLDVHEESVGYEIRTSKDPSGTASDATITLDPEAMKNEMWFDPTPDNRFDEDVPYNKEDAFSLFLHELGHTLGFQGWRNWTTGKLPGDVESRFDRFVTVAHDGTPYFNGPAAKAAYGDQRVPLTYSNLYHLGNDTFGTEDGNGLGRPGDLLMDDVMSGTGQDWGTRTWISALDIAVLQDIGLPISNEAPTISAIADQFLVPNAAGETTFSIGDAESPADRLTLNVSSSDESMLPAFDFHVTRNGNQVTIPLYAAQKGQATMTIRVNDGLQETTRTFTVSSGNDRFPWRNLQLRFDVSNDFEVTAGDALMIINRLNTLGPGPLPWRDSDLVAGQFYDVDMNNAVTANDALAVINYINDPQRKLEQSLEAAEGESTLDESALFFFIPPARK